MINDKKVIGLCLTKVNNRSRAGYISAFHEQAVKFGYKLMIFNSIKDFYNNDVYDEGSKSVYEVINYDIVDVLVVFYDNFCNEKIALEIIDNAHKHDTPVIVVGAQLDKCYCIIRDYEDAFKDVIRHVIVTHGITDTCFIAGRKDHDPESELRIQYYKEVLAENNLPFSEDMIHYGGYWAVPTKEMVLQQLQSHNRPPRGIICANDSMAISLCETLMDYGYKIPEDVAVTGFDGIPDGKIFTPPLTTCMENITQLAQKCMEIVTASCSGDFPYGVSKYNYTTCIRQSCGCNDCADHHSHDMEYTFQMFRDLEEHEAYMYSWLDRVLSGTNVSQITNLLAQCILPDSYVCINPYLLSFGSKSTNNKINQHQPEALICISPKASHIPWDELPIILRSSIAPDLESWADSDSTYIINPLFAGNQVCGYYLAPVNEMLDNTHKINRIAKSINIAFNYILNQLTQKHMKLSIENAAHSNPITGLPNLKGAASWFEDFAFIEKNHNRILSISVYRLPEYKYIYENYGVQDIEEVLCMIADTLDLVNPEECFIAHISEDEFVTINYFSDQDSAQTITDRVVADFLNHVEQYNSTNTKKYYLDVNTGYTIIPKDWDGSLASYIRLAGNDMYIKRIKSGMTAVVKEQNVSKDNYSAFNLLVEMNLFHYHFQPIVNAKTGEIYAYEALMRPDSSIGMNPLQVLETAGIYKRLYDIERATIFNVMERFSKEFNKFNGHKVFINSIPGYFLNNQDNQIVSERYAEYMKYVVFEITEQNSVSDEELAAIKRVGNANADNHIAIDDYGTGHSNIVNLLRYTPQIIKIDRFLISDIHNDINKQMFVRSTIEFAAINHIQVLAEGVENAEELKMVIQLGVDYVQGYYTGRPGPEPIPYIDHHICEEIIKANQTYL